MSVILDKEFAILSVVVNSMSQTGRPIATATKVEVCLALRAYDMIALSIFCLNQPAFRAHSGHNFFSFQGFKKFLRIRTLSLDTVTLMHSLITLETHPILANYAV